MCLVSADGNAASGLLLLLLDLLLDLLLLLGLHRLPTFGPSTRGSGNRIRRIRSGGGGPSDAWAARSTTRGRGPRYTFPPLSAPVDHGPTSAATWLSGSNRNLPRDRGGGPFWCLLLLRLLLRLLLVLLLWPRRPGGGPLASLTRVYSPRGPPPRPRPSFHPTSSPVGSPLP